MSHLTNYGYRASILEESEADLVGKNSRQDRRYPLPRHLSQLETKSHRGYSPNLKTVRVLPKTCQVSAAKHQSKTNLAVDVLKYQISDLQIKQKHLESVRQSLERRLKVAENRGDICLIAMLNDEFQQL